jgi:Phospholipase_D-nuclease N-terminal
MTRLLPLVLGLAVVVFALVDCLQSPAQRVRTLPKPAWVAAILLVPLAGAVAWLIAGRPRSKPDAAPRPPPRPVAPDDDPDFLRQLRSIDEEHERMLRQWERDLRRREGDLGRGEAPGSAEHGDAPAGPSAADSPPPPSAPPGPPADEEPRPDDGRGPGANA